MTELFGGERTFSTGFGIGFDRTLLALEKEGHDAPKHEVDAFVIPVTASVRHQAFRITSMLRGSNITTEVDLMGRSLSKNFKYADSIRAKRAIIVGEKELAQDSVSVRDMKTGEQRSVKLSELVSELSN